MVFVTLFKDFSEMKHHAALMRDYPTCSSSSSLKHKGYEMLCCAGKCRESCFSSSNNNNNNNSINTINNNNDGDDLNPYLIFDNYSEMKRAYAEDCSSATSDSAAPAKIANNNNKFAINKLPTASEFIKSKNNNPFYEVFLGGSCNPTTWRRDIAIPELKKLGITYFNPQVSNWEPELIEIEHKAKTNAQVLFYVLDNQTRSTVSMIEVAYLVAKKRIVILVITGFKGPGQKILDEPITQTEYDELTRSSDRLSDLVERHGIPVFNDIQSALQCTAKVIREKIQPHDLKLIDLGQQLQNSNLKLWICSNLKKTFDNLDTCKKGEISLADFRLAYRILMHRELTREEILDVLEGLKNVEKDVNNSTPPPSSLITETPLKKESNSNSNSNGVNGTMINFEQFCYIMAELIYHHRNRNNNNSNSNSNSNSNNRSWSHQLANKATYVVKNVSLALTRLLENVPGSKPTSGWIPLSSKSESDSKTLHDVYLGGPISSSQPWRTDIVIPHLKKHGLTCLNPETHSPLDTLGLEKCRVLFFYLPDSSRSLECSVTAVYYLGLGRQVVLCIENLQTDCQVEGEKLSQIAVKDYNRSRSYVEDMAKRENVPVFSVLEEALQCVVEKCN